MCVQQADTPGASFDNWQASYETQVQMQDVPLYGFSHPISAGARTSRDVSKLGRTRFHHLSLRSVVSCCDPRTVAAMFHIQEFKTQCGNLHSILGEDLLRT